MSTIAKLRVGVVSAGISCLFLSLALAQQDQSSRGSSGTRSSGSGASQSTSGQSGRSSSAQSGRSTSEYSGQSGQSRSANFRGVGGQSQEVEQYLASCLLVDNQAEVELSQFAQQQAKSSEVKEFAQRMVQDHQKMIQQLQQVAGAQSSAGQGSSGLGSSSSGTSGTSGAGSSDSTSGTSSSGTLGTGTSGTSRSGATGTSGSGTSDTSSTSGSGTSGTSGSRTSGTNGVSGAGTSGTSGSTDIGTSSSDTSSGLSGSSTTGGASTSSAGSSVNSLGAGGAAAALAGGSGGAVHQLMQIDRQIVDRKSQAIRQELQQKSGAEFDKAFVGTAINAHIHALAALEVIGQQTQGQLSQIAQQARPTVQQHLDHAKQLMRTLEGESGSSGSSSARRSSSQENR